MRHHNKARMTRFAGMASVLVAKNRDDEDEPSEAKCNEPKVDDQDCVHRSIPISSSCIVLALPVIPAMQIAEQQSAAQRFGAVVALPAGQQCRLAHGKRRIAVSLFGGFGLVGQVLDFVHAVRTGIACA
jgi:hypothetical protein